MCRRDVEGSVDKVIYLKGNIQFETHIDNELSR